MQALNNSGMLDNNSKLDLGILETLINKYRRRGKLPMPMDSEEFLPALEGLLIDS